MCTLLPDAELLDTLSDRFKIRIAFGPGDDDSWETVVVNLCEKQAGASTLPQLQPGQHCHSHRVGWLDKDRSVFGIFGVLNVLEHFWTLFSN